MMDWIFWVYILFVILMGITSAIKELQKQKVNIPKKIELYTQEERLEKGVEEKVKREIQKVRIEPKDAKETLTVTKKIKSEEKPFIFLEKDLKERLPEAIILMEILGPPKAFRGFGLPYRQKYQ
ncbi:MAG: hypothetical protein NZ841_00625 [Dictyoglomus sp.]|nr:hypothetical protein [Dictyoglomus sp.]MCX7941590.1 hypothetical protein [Dictyoglomaceae bacterium]MDW8187791.1 hypothetical protein [Dictyoglomus sp.]